MKSDKPQLQPGVYTLRCVKCQDKRAKASGHSYISVECEIVDAPDRYKVWEIIMLEGKGKTLGALKIAGWGFKAGSSPSCDEFIGRTAQAHLDYEDWNGEPWLKVKAFATKLGGYAVPKELDGDEPPHAPQHRNPQKPAGRPKTRPVVEDDAEGGEDWTPF